MQRLTVLDLEELEGCHALWQRRNQTLPQLLDAWRNSPYGDAAFRNYLSYEIGGSELGRPDDVQQALAESFSVIQQHLGTPGQWTPPEELHDRVTRQPVTTPEPRARQPQPSAGLASPPHAASPAAPIPAPSRRTQPRTGAITVRAGNHRPGQPGPAVAALAPA